MARRRESVEPFLRATAADDDYDNDDDDGATSPRPAELARSTSTRLLPRLIVLGAVSMLALLWGASALVLRPSSSSSSLAVPHSPADQHHHHTAQRSNATLQPVAVAATSGNWTVPLPTLPLTPEALRRSCDAAQNYHHGHQHHDYYWADPTFVDPTATTAAGGGADGRTLVYALAAASGSAQGLAESLLEVFSAYGLAAAEQRRFVLDDRDWPWGGWEDYFLAPPPASSSSAPRPGAGPAVPVEAVPCPRHAQAIVAAHTTRTYMFGHAFSEHFERPQFAGSRRQQHIFALAAAGYAHLFRLQPALEDDAQARVRELTARAGDGAWVAVHVRRGSLKPHTWAWHKSAIPLDVFVDAAVELIDSVAGQQPAQQQERGRVVVVSDDPAVPDAPQLAGSFSPWNSNGRQGGGGGGGAGMMAGGYSPNQLLALSMADRVALGREFVVQLRVVAELLSRRNSSSPSSGEGASSQAGVVCAAGSATCRLLAVMLGWELSVEMERWKDVDGGLGWRGIDW